MIDRAGAQAALRVQKELASVSVTGTLTDIAFTPPAGQIIGQLSQF